MRTQWIVGFAVGVLAFGGGCGRSAKVAATVDARNSGTYNAWRSAAASQHSPEEWQEYEACVQEIRLRAMTEGSSGSEAVAEALFRRIDGKTFVEVLQLGYEAKLERLEAMRAELKRFVDANALVVPKPGDASSAVALDRRRREQQDRLQALLNEIATTTRRFEALGGAAKTAMADRDNAKPAVLTREAALDEVKQMMKHLRDASIFQYGAWPVRLEHDAAGLPAAVRAEFEQKRAAATQGRAVVAVHIRGQWTIFDAEVPLPAFSAAVTANLTEADLADIARRWTDLQAELWARRTQSAGPDAQPAPSR